VSRRFQNDMDKAAGEDGPPVENKSGGVFTFQDQT
jgi:hypothetical protein